MEIRKRYRPNVAAIILSSNYPHKCEFFLGKRSGYKKNSLAGFPQGESDKGRRTPKGRLSFRRASREGGFGIGSQVVGGVHLLEVFPFLGLKVIGLFQKQEKGGEKGLTLFDGQTQKYFLVKLKKGAEIKSRQLR